MKRILVIAAALAAASPASASDMAFAVAMTKWADAHCGHIVPPAVRMGLAMVAPQPSAADVDELVSKIDASARRKYEGDVPRICAEAMVPTLADLSKRLTPVFGQPHKTPG